MNIMISVIFFGLLHSRGLLEIMNEKKTRTGCVSAGHVALPPQNCRIIIIIIIIGARLFRGQTLYSLLGSKR